MVNDNLHVHSRIYIHGLTVLNGQMSMLQNDQRRMKAILINTPYRLPISLFALSPSTSIMKYLSMYSMGIESSPFSETFSEQ